MKIKLLSSLATIPTRGSADAAGWDLYAAIPAPLTIAPGANYPVPTDISMEIPQGYWGGIYARSGLACKKGLRPSNLVGVIDSDYRGNVIVSLYNDSPVPQTIEPGDRIAQFILHKVNDITFEVVDELSDTERSGGGFGSTGK